ncbi:hypothetical protein GF389_01020 [Candidatus Dojkabacteria bacterium]|nr:hypothetical protein [Candidatus Dojkabacteria bacterium]
MVNKTEDNTQKGIRFEATFAQLFSAIILVLVLFALPVGGYEYIKTQLSDDQEVYTASSLRQSDIPVDGRIAGISDERYSESPAEQVGTVFESKYLLLGVGVVLVFVSIALSTGLLYDFIKK